MRINFSSDEGLTSQEKINLGAAIDAPAGLSAFRSKAVEMPWLIDRLQAAPDRAAFLRLVLELGSRHGFVFSEAEVELALREERKRRLEKNFP